jgi:dienelactone hydrolase
MRRLALLAVLCVGCASARGVEVRDVNIPGAEVELQARLVLPDGPARPPAVVALHGCGGPYPARDRQWQEILTGAGHPVLFPDSFASRGLGPQCKERSRQVRPGRERRADAVAAVRWLLKRDGTPPGGIVVLGWSNGGSTVLAAAAQGVMPEGAVRGFIAFYPGCRAYVDRDRWAPSAPLLILVGAEDDWTPAEPCRRLAARFPDRITLVEYPGAYHDFDAPNRPVTARTGLAYTANGDGVAHAGTNPAAREDAIRRVLAFLERP